MASILARVLGSSTSFRHPQGPSQKGQGSFVLLEAQLGGERLPEARLGLSEEEEEGAADSTVIETSTRGSFRRPAPAK